MKNTLLLIFAALALMIGSFIWFVASWDSAAESPVSLNNTTAAPFILAKKLPPEASP